MKVHALAANMQSWLVGLRRYFHMHPEPSFEEVNTSNKVVAELTRLGIPTVRMAKTGVVGSLAGGKPGPTVALRADMDALSIKEKTGLPFASQNVGYMHACGHDCHMTCLLGAAAILAELKDEIAGTVKFFFQPAEELVQGAKAMVAEGAMEGVDAVFGLHVLGDLPVGTVNVVPGPRMASADIFEITVNGKGGHGSAPHQGVDAILVGAAIIMNLQSVVSRELNPLDPVVVHVGKLVAGDRFNIIASQAWLEGANRTFNPDIRKQLPDIMQRVLENTAAAYRATVEMEYTWGCPPLINDADLAKLAQRTVKKLFGAEALVDMPPLTGSEDFPFFAQRAPGAYVFLGVGNKEKGIGWPLHHSQFDVDEDALPIGVAIQAQLALDYLAAQGNLN
ncbi:MAG TPA: amidohydrolase [bacterium]|jgi:amidohydrolase|nr:amidohydrolase [bacterium]